MAFQDSRLYRRKFDQSGYGRYREDRTEILTGNSAGCSEMTQDHQLCIRYGPCQIHHRHYHRIRDYQTKRYQKSSEEALSSDDEIGFSRRDNL